MTMWQSSPLEFDNVQVEKNFSKDLFLSQVVHEFFQLRLENSAYQYRPEI